MQRLIAALVTALAVVVLPQYAAAQDGKRPERPNPDVMFNRLDANHDGVITANEIPAGMPERLKNLLAQAIKSHGGKLTKAELSEVISHRPAPRPDGSGRLVKTGTGHLVVGSALRDGPRPGGPGPMAIGFGPGPQAFGPGPQSIAPPPRGMVPPPQGPGSLAMAGPGRAPANGGSLVINGGTLVLNGGTLVINNGTLVIGGPVPPPKGVPPQGRQISRPSLGKAMPPPMFNARAIFDRLDTNKDGKLSFEEFSVGLRQLHRLLAARVQEWKKPFQGGMQFARQKMRAYAGVYTGTTTIKGGIKGPMGAHPGMKPMGPPHGGFAQGHHGSPDGKVVVHGTLAFGLNGPEGAKHEVKKTTVCKCGAKTPAECTCGTKKPDGKKHEMKKPVVCSKCGATTPEACTCGVKKPAAEKPARHVHSAEKATAGNRSIEARLTALEQQQAEILTLLRTTRPDGKGSHHGRSRSEHEDRD